MEGPALPSPRSARSGRRLVAASVAPLSLACLLAACVTVRAAERPTAAELTWDELPVTEKFLSPVGDPEDFSKPASGERDGYAVTRGLLKNRRRPHLGLDLANQRSGGKVRAPADGIVLEARRYPGWGQLVVIVHRMPGGDAVLSLMAHLKPGSVTVKPGQHVRAGQPVAAVGSSGRSSGPHLHLEFRDLGHVDPWQTLWEQAPVLDPLRVLGSQLADVLVPGLRDPGGAVGGPESSDPWGDSCLRALTATGTWAGGAPGDPEALLERREFYTWLARLSGGRLSQRPSWSTVRRALERRGFTELPGAHAAAKPVGREEAAHALSHLLSTDFLPAAPEELLVSEAKLRARGLPVPAPVLSAEPSLFAGPDRPLTRAEGALLVMGARSWPGAVATAR